MSPDVGAIDPGRINDTRHQNEYRVAGTAIEPRQYIESGATGHSEVTKYSGQFRSGHQVDGRPDILRFEYVEPHAAQHLREHESRNRVVVDDEHRLAGSPGS
jgi:hypothetical protein